jgi:hypothetical protein
VRRADLAISEGEQIEIENSHEYQLLDLAGTRSSRNSEAAAAKREWIRGSRGFCLRGISDRDET